MILETLPAHGVGLWLEDNAYCILFPGPLPQIIKIPIGEEGRLRNVLAHREAMLKKGHRPTIGTLGAPVQYDIDRVAEHLTREDEESREARKAKALAAARKALMRRVDKRIREKEADKILELAGLT